MIEALATIIINTCGSPDNLDCVDFFVNCSVDNQGKISDTRVQQCIVDYKQGARHNANANDKSKVSL